jgi:hypothetical protein
MWQGHAFRHVDLISATVTIEGLSTSIQLILADVPNSAFRVPNMPTFICILAEGKKSDAAAGEFDITDTRGRIWICSVSTLPDADFAQIEAEQMETAADPEDLQLGSVIAQQRYETCERSELPARLSIDMEPLQEAE